MSDAPRPSRPARRDPQPFPLLGVLAPLVVSGVLVVVTGSVAMLGFALLSPVLAVASLVDGRLASGRAARRDEARFEADLAVWERERRRVVAETMAAAERAHPSAARIAAAADDVRTWSAQPPIDALRIGCGEAGPVTVGTRATVAFRGDAPLVASAERALAAQRLRAGVEPPSAERPDLIVELRGLRAAHVVAAGPSLGALADARFAPDLLTVADLDRVRAVGPSDGEAPPLADLPSARPTGLAARFLVDGSEPVEIDLVAHGPHAVVGGTTGSGKSTLLVAWMLALAATHPPEALTLLLVDCKGGAAFDAIAALPHVAGVVTDLERDGAERAVRSLAAELRRRERVLRGRRLADVADSDLPRLVVVVDEFRALLDASPELAEAFVDVAARGRSLGVHLILCTQRPAGAMRDDLLANCGLRLALRLHDAADSVSLVGTAAAAGLPRHPAGGVVLLVPGEAPRRLRVAALDAAGTAALLVRLQHRSDDSRPVDRPWLDPLPARAELARLPPIAAPGVALGLLDLPDEQRQPVAVWEPSVRPRLLVAGAARSGRTTALATIAMGLGGARLLSTDPAQAWEQVQSDAVPLLVDGLPVLLDRLGERHAVVLLDRLAKRLRSDSAPTVLALPGPSAWSGHALRPLAALLDATLLLGLSLEDHLALGGERSTWRRLPPGGGWWDGARIQVACGAAFPVAPRTAAAPLLALETPALLVTARPGARRAALRASGVRTAAPEEAPDATAPAIAVADATAWQAAWTSSSRWREAAGGVLLDGVDPVDTRALLGSTALPPPVAGDDEVVLVPTEGTPTRRRLPVPRPDRGPIQRDASASSSTPSASRS